MRILVTGGTGVIGAGAVRELLGAEHQIRLLSRNAEKDAPAFPAAVEAFAADISDGKGLSDAVHDCDIILHIAGIVDEEPPDVTYQKINVDGTRHLLNVATEGGQPYFIFVSSLGAERGKSDYHQSKLRAEKLVQAYSGPWLILRPGNVYGPGDDTLSMLMKLIRGAPAIPVIEGGDQRFQPLWYADFGAAIAQAVTNRRLAGRVLELAGPDVTTTNAVLDRLAEITGRNPPRLPVPLWLAQFGAAAADALDGAGKKIMQASGFTPPINMAKLQMLLEENVIPDSSQNALLTEFVIKPTPLADGLEMLADLVPEQTPGDGVGAVERSIYFADIVGAPHSPAELLNLVCDRITEVMPLEFAAEPGAPTQARKGATLCAAIPGRGNIQVRVQERTDTRVTLVTVGGHPLAGVVTLRTDQPGAGVRFAVETTVQPSNIFDWAAMKTFGGMMQSQNWRNVVRRVVELSGGQAPEGVRSEKRTISEDEIRELKASAERLVQERQREELEQHVAGSQRDRG